MSAIQLSADYLPITEAAKRLGVTTARVKQLIAAGTLRNCLPPGPLVRCWLIPKAEIARHKRKKPGKRGWPKGKPWPDNDLRRQKKLPKSDPK